MYKNIKSFFRFVFIYKPLNEYQAHATLSKRIKYHAINFLRRVIIISIVIILSASGFATGKYFYPHIIYADKIVQVEKEQIFPPMLKKICTAESGWKQFKANGDVVRGIVNKSDVGICQINEAINNDSARSLGYDIFTEAGNKAFAVYLFNTQGVAPWEASRCGIHGWSPLSVQCKK